MKNNNKLIHYSLLVLIFGVGFFTLLAHTVLHASFHQHRGFTPTTYSCPTIGQTYEIDIQDTKFSPNTLSVKQCDVVVFKNVQQRGLFVPAFGEHPSHFAYPGFEEKVLGYGQKNTLLATMKGKFSFHDHLKDHIDGELIVQ